MPFEVYCVLFSEETCQSKVYFSHKFEQDEIPLWKLTGKENANFIKTLYKKRKQCNT